MISARQRDPVPQRGQWSVHGLALVMSTSCMWPFIAIRRPLTVEVQSVPVSECVSE